MLAAYELHEEIGRGGMGVVYRATDTRLGRVVALKIVHKSVAEAAGIPVDELRKRLRQEAQLAARVIHSNVVTVFAYEEVGDDALIAMELVNGRTLAELIRRGQRWSPRDAALLLAQAADGVAAAHQVGVIHRDLKPGNVMIADGGRCKVLDFGIAKAVTSDLAAAVSRTTFGTVQYMAPEQVLGRAATTATDVWALALIGYELITGAPAFGDGAAITIGMRVAGEEPPMLADNSKSVQLFGPLAEVLSRALNKQESARYRDAAALRDALLHAARVCETHWSGNTPSAALSGYVATDTRFSTTIAGLDQQNATLGRSVPASQSARRYATTLLVVLAIGGSAAVAVSRASHDAQRINAAPSLPPRRSSFESPDTVARMQVPDTPSAPKTSEKTSVPPSTTAPRLSVRPAPRTDTLRAMSPSIAPSDLERLSLGESVDHIRRVDTIAAASRYVVAFATMADEQQARNLASRIRVGGQSPRVATRVQNGAREYLVVLGPFASRDAAERLGQSSGQRFWIYEETR